ncbi:hypothetical protein N7513_004729 [Penicillium frequentans]|uniref:Uncharacterized protein n=1 Tax=Penicillium frequentans TaxID=3151616 RepID=A0AAD6D7A3_9EURO|nr:hypothetical protein N7513_004729 [Penicillium glabrum]KAJ5556693.1 hypothetical protein N7494_000608 [Penicillium glabrum]
MGFTTPFIRRATAEFNARQEKQFNTTTPSNRGRSQTPSSESVLNSGEEEQELLPQMSKTLMVMVV